MKYLLAILWPMIIQQVFSQDTQGGNPPAELKKYYFTELITNENRAEISRNEQDCIQRKHLAYIAGMIDKGILMLAGPFENGGGILILKVAGLEEAKELIESDPAVDAGRLKYEIRIWFTIKGVFTNEQNNEQSTN